MTMVDAHHSPAGAIRRRIRNGVRNAIPARALASATANQVS
jgi:hypothetical protein